MLMISAVSMTCGSFFLIVVHVLNPAADWHDKL